MHGMRAAPRTPSPGHRLGKQSDDKAAGREDPAEGTQGPQEKRLDAKTRRRGREDPKQNNWDTYCFRPSLANLFLIFFHCECMNFNSNSMHASRTMRQNIK